MKQAPLLKVRILRNDHVAVSFGVLPNGEVVSITETYFPYVEAFGINVSQQTREAWGEVLIKQQFHVPVT